VLSIVAVFLGALLVLLHNHKPDLCASNDAPPAHLVALIDTTDEMLPAEVHAMRMSILQRVVMLEPGAHLSLLAIREGSAGPVAQTFFSSCRPRDGSNASSVDDNEQLLRKQYRKTFEQPLEKAIAEIAALKSTATSPILASLYQVAGLLQPEAYIPHRGVFRASTIRRTLLVVSDLIEYSDELNQYRNGYRWADVQQFPRVSAMQGKLSGVEVTVLLRTNAHTRPYQNAAHRQFWEAYLRTAGVTTARFEPL
jgi:hypothetical protein